MTPVGATAGEMRRGGRVLAGSMLGIGTGVSGQLLYTNGLFLAGLAATCALFALLPRYPGQPERRP